MSQIKTNELFRLVAKAYSRLFDICSPRIELKLGTYSCTHFMYALTYLLTS